jgi:multicomponent Na+:H+ antiporter subunit B
VTARVRLALFLPSAAVLGALLLWGLSGLPRFGDYHGPYGIVLNHVAVGERHATDVVTSIVFDYRGLDTMGEELILFTSVIGVALLLRELKDEKQGRPRQSFGGDALRAVGFGLVGPAVVLGLYVVLHGYLTPGGGFQGGVVLAGALLLVYLAGDYRAYRAVSPTAVVDLAEGLGAAAFVAIGLVALFLGDPFLHNLLPLGKKGSLLSAGSIPLLNLATALEVAGAFTLLFTEFLEDLVISRGGDD